MPKIRVRKVWLSRQRTGDYMFTYLQPKLCPILGTDKLDWYLQEGDPIGLRHFCNGGIYSFFGIDIPIGTQVQIEMRISNEIIYDEKGNPQPAKKEE